MGDDQSDMLETIDAFLDARGVPSETRGWVLVLIRHALDGEQYDGLDLASVHPSVAYRLGAFHMELINEAEKRGYEAAMRGMEAADKAVGQPVPQGARVLLNDARLMLAEATERGPLSREMFAAWDARLRLVLETGEYPGLTTQLLDDPRDARIGGGSEPS